MLSIKNATRSASHTKPRWKAGMRSRPLVTRSIVFLMDRLAKAATPPLTRRWVDSLASSPLRGDGGSQLPTPLAVGSTLRQYAAPPLVPPGPAVTVPAEPLVERRVRGVARTSR
jgi:hypothetical protein